MEKFPAIIFDLYNYIKELAPSPKTKTKTF